MPEVTDLMRVAQYVKSDRDAPADVHNAACRMLSAPDEVEQLREDRAVSFMQVLGWKSRTEKAEAAIESVRQYAAELRTTTSPAGIAAVYADRLEELLPARAVKAPESNGDGRPPQTLGATEGQEAGETPGAAQ